MIRHSFTIGAAAAALTLGLTATAWAQAGSRPNTTGSSTGTAVPTGGGSAVPSGGGSSSGSSGSSGSGGSSMGSGASSTSSSGGGVYDTGRRSAPQRAVPRSPSSSGGGGRSATAPAGSRRNPEATAVPSYSRPRDGRTPTGEVMDRRTPIPGRDNNYYYPYSYYFDPYYYGGYGYRYSYYSPYYSRYWLPGYGFGFGYFAYDPFWYDPFYAGYGGGGYAGGYGRQYNGSGSVRLKVKPGHAQVYVDGYYVGVVDSFDGVFQRLSLDAGAHRIEVKAEGFEPVQFEVNLRPGETVTYKGELRRQ